MNENSFGAKLRQYFDDYDIRQDASTSMLAFLTAQPRLQELRACCLNNGIDYSEKDIRNFIQNLITVDPEGKSLLPEYNNNYIDYQESGRPLRYGIIDYNNHDDNNFDTTKIPGVDDSFMLEQPEYRDQNFKTKFKKPIKRLRKEKFRVRPVCNNNTCTKLAYFGLPFCPWCMRQLPPFFPSKNDETDNKHAIGGGVIGVKPILDMEDLNPMKACDQDEETVTIVAGGVASSFSQKDILVDDGDIRVTYRDVLLAKKDIDKYIPR